MKWYDPATWWKESDKPVKPVTTTTKPERKPKQQPVWERAWKRAGWLNLVWIPILITAAPIGTILFWAFIILLIVIAFMSENAEDDIRMTRIMRARKYLGKK